MRNFRFYAAAMLTILLFAPISRAGTVHGTVNNGTRGKPGAGVEVVSTLGLFRDTGHNVIDLAEGVVHADGEVGHEL